MIALIIDPHGRVARRLNALKRSGNYRVPRARLSLCSRDWKIDVSPRAPI